MREIKFRGLSESGKWLYGCLSEIGRYTTIMSKGIGEIVDAKTIGQYTGVKDSKGREIYEGDIIKYREYCFEIIYTLYCAFCARPLDAKWIFRPELNQTTASACEVIGNTYENPELLEREENK